MSSKGEKNQKSILQPQAQYKGKLEGVHGTEPSKFKEQI